MIRAVLFLGFTLGLCAHAEPPDLNRILANCGDSIPASWNQESDAAQARACSYAKKVVCETVRAAGCAEGAAVVDWEVNRIGGYLTEATACCGGECNAEPRPVATTPPPSVGRPEGHKILAANERANADHKIRVAGRCRAFKEMCRESTAQFLSGLLDEEREAQRPQIEEWKAACARLSNPDTLEHAASDFVAKAKVNDRLAADTSTASSSGQQAQPGDTTSQPSQGSVVREKPATPTNTTNSTNPTYAQNPNLNSGQPSYLGMMATQMLMGMLPTLMQQLLGNNATSTPNVGAVDCSVNPALAGCSSAQVPQSTWAQQNAFSGEASESGADGSFNLPNGMAGGSSSPQLAGGARGTPIQAAAVPNGGGGGIPGSGGSMAAASLGGGAPAAPAAASGSSKVNISEGGRSGYSQMAANMNLQPATAGTISGTNSDGSMAANMDLSQFLPGGPKDPARGLASVANSPNQIQPASVNIFARMSARIRSRCAQGLLRDCGP